MPDYYVAFVKEYLELQGFIVRTEVKYAIKEKDKRGTLRTSWGDIDILATKVQDSIIAELILGEVKGESQTKKGIQEINRKKFENPHIKRKVRELFGPTKYKKCLYCWSWDNPKTKELAQKLGIIPISFDEIVTYILDKVEEHRGWFYLMDYPNLMLLQFLKARGFLKERRTHTFFFDVGKKENTQ